MKITREDIDHLAKLSDLSLSNEEAETLSVDLENILGYISQLDELDVKDVEPTFQCTELENVWRPDEIIPQDATREQLLALTKDEEDHQIKVPKVL